MNYKLFVCDEVVVSGVREKTKVFLRQKYGDLGSCPFPSGSVSVVTAHSQILPANFLVWGQGGAPTLPGQILPIYQPHAPLQRRNSQGGPQQNPKLLTAAHMLALVF